LTYRCKSATRFLIRLKSNTAAMSKMSPMCNEPPNDCHAASNAQARTGTGIAGSACSRSTFTSAGERRRRRRPSIGIPNMYMTTIPLVHVIVDDPPALAATRNTPPHCLAPPPPHPQCAMSGARANKPPGQHKPSHQHGAATSARSRHISTEPSHQHGAVTSARSRHISMEPSWTSHTGRQLSMRPMVV